MCPHRGRALVTSSVGRSTGAVAARSWLPSASSAPFRVDPGGSMHPVGSVRPGCVLTAQTLFQETSSAPTDYAITGGTGAYRDAGGFLAIHNPNVTLHIDDLS